MVVFEPPLRSATPADAMALAELIDIAGDGLPSTFWAKVAAPGEDPWEVGRRMQARKAVDGKAYVVDEGAGAVATMMGYPIAREPEPVAQDAEPMFVPLIELENLAPATWYVNVLAAYPAYRGRGHGSRLLRLAEALADEAGLSAMSVIVASGNDGARRLYERVGYSERARRAVVKGNGWDSTSREWILLAKEL